MDINGLDTVHQLRPQPTIIGTGFFHGNAVSILSMRDVTINEQVVDTSVTFTPNNDWTERHPLTTFEWRSGNRYTTSSDNIHLLRITGGF